MIFIFIIIFLWFGFMSGILIVAVCFFNKVHDTDTNLDSNYIKPYTRDLITKKNYLGESNEYWENTRI